jgi:formate hydrogenlyase subunit 6/NADH:ubiquinone oxidoreductase subunit I
MKKRRTYFGKIARAFRTVAQGLRLTARHYRKGSVRNVPLGIQDPEYFKQSQGPITIQYPMEKVPVPDIGRYRLHMETDDCIGCDKCARICPVDCITIETFRADGDLGRTSDGTTKRLHLPVFDIDMGKCMYCGLCTTVCPTECLTMTKVYDFSEYDRDNLVYHFGAYSPADEDRIRLETQVSLDKKKQEKAGTTAAAPATPSARPILKRAPVAVPPVEEADTSSTALPEEEKPVARPRPMLRRGPATPPADAPQDIPPVEEAPLNAAPDAPADTPTVPPAARTRPVMRRGPAAPAEDAPQDIPPVEEAPVNTAPDAPTDTPAVPPAARPRPVMRRGPATPAEDAPQDTPPVEEAPLNTAPDAPADTPAVPPAARPRPVMRRGPATPPADAPPDGSDQNPMDK